MSVNTLFLRLEGPLQSWGTEQSKFVIRRTSEAPTKSGIIGMCCAALGISRQEAANGWLQKLSELRIAVRIDVPGVRWWDYHTVGAGMMMRTSENRSKTKPGPLVTRREYLCDASFLVILQGEHSLVAELEIAVNNPRWPIYLGRKCCTLSRPLLVHPAGDFPNLVSALKSIPWQPRLAGDPMPQTVDCLIDWEPTIDQPEPPDDALIFYDVPLTFDPPSHCPRFVIRESLIVGKNREIGIAEKPAQNKTPRPSQPRADYRNTEYRHARIKRLDADHHLCILCKSPATTVQHITYRRAGGNETPDDLRSLCRLCHDAVTMIEYGAGMGLDRINPEEKKWREQIIEKRSEIIRFRSIETRRRHLSNQEV